MTAEISVYSSVIKDIIFGLVGLVVFWIVRYPQWIYFAGHSLTWVVFFLYIASDNNSLFVATLALVISVAVCLLDVWIGVTLVCFLGDFCCIGTATDAPFSFGMQVCGDNNRYETDSFIYLAVTTVSLAVLSGVARVSSIYTTRTSASLYLVGAVAYILLKGYLLAWHNVHYSTFFITMTSLTMATVFTAVAVSQKYHFVATCLFLIVMLVDLSVVLGATDAVHFLNNYTLETKKVYVRRRLMGVEDDAQLTSTLTSGAVQAFQRFPTTAARAALSGAASALAAFVADPAFSASTAEAATAVLETARSKFLEFADGLRASVNELLDSAGAADDADTALSVDLGAKGADLVARADAVMYVLQETPCCDPNTRFDVTLSRLNERVAEYSARFESDFYGKTTVMMAAVQTAQLDSAALTQQSTASENVANTPQVSNAEIHSWVGATQHFLLRVWRRIVGTANSINVNTVQPAAALSATLADRYAAQAAAAYEGVSQVIESKAVQAAQIAASCAAAQASAAHALAKMALSVSTTAALDAAAAAASEAARAESIVATAAATAASVAASTGATGVSALENLAASAAESALKAAQAQAAAAAVFANGVVTDIEHAAQDATQSAANAAAASASAVRIAANTLGDDVTGLVVQAQQAAASAFNSAKRAGEALLRLIPAFGYSPWLNVPKFIKVIWTVIHCICSAFNLVCIATLWGRDIDFKSYFGAGRLKKYESEPEYGGGGDAGAGVKVSGGGRHFGLSNASKRAVKTSSAGPAGAVSGAFHVNV